MTPAVRNLIPIGDLFASWSWVLALIIIYGMRGFALYNRIICPEEIFGSMKIYDKIVIHGALIIFSVYGAFKVRQYLRMMEFYRYWDMIFFDFLAVDQ